MLHQVGVLFDLIIDWWLEKVDIRVKVDFVLMGRGKVRWLAFVTQG